MTPEKLAEILTTQPADQVVEFQISSFKSTPKWSDLVKEYDPMKHKIFDTTLYPIKKDDKGIDDFKRTALGLQQLAVKRVAQSMFSTPVQRMYNYDRNNTAHADAVKLLEELYRTRNSIDCTNIERAKQLNATCQVVTIWSTYEKEMKVGLETSKFTLKHNVYSEMEGYTLYPIIDPNGDLLVMSVGYKDSDDKDNMVTYINAVGTSKPKVIVYINDSGWKVVDGFPKDLEGAFPVLYMNAPEPVWGGQSGTLLVEQLEEMESYQGLYIKRNTLPTFTLDYGKIAPGSVQTTTAETSSDSRRIVVVGEGGKMTDVTWEGATAAIEARYARIRNSFFEQIQVPDTSFANMISSNTSADNKELIFADSRAKAEDLGGEYEKMFFAELEIVKAYAKIMFPKYAAALDLISIRSIIKPYNVRTKKENAEYVSLAGPAMSKETQVSILGEVDDVAQEVKLIEDESGASANQL